jgi:hypothetical protein
VIRHDETIWLEDYDGVVIMPLRFPGGTVHDVGVYDTADRIRGKLGIPDWSWPFCDRCKMPFVLKHNSYEPYPCRNCPPEGMVKCPATHKNGATCVLCKGTGVVEELK